MRTRFETLLIVVVVVVTACGGADGTRGIDAYPTVSLSTTTAATVTTEEAGAPTSNSTPDRYGSASTPTSTTSSSTTVATTTTTEAVTTTTEGVTTSTVTPTTSADTTTTAGALEAEIEIEGFSFGAPLRVKVGTAVTVVNRDSVSHTWTSRDGVFDSGTLAPGDRFTYVFDQPGEFAFFCRIHPSMTGTITVDS